MGDFEAFVSAFFYIFVIIDPFASLPLFLTLTKKFKESEARHAARDAVLIAGATAFAFLFAGGSILNMLRIDINSFRIAGGMILALLGIETVLGIQLAKNGKEEKDAVTALIATPMLTGPGLITTLIVMSVEDGYGVPMIATAAALFVSWLVLDNAGRIGEIAGSQTISTLTKVAGIFLVAIGVSYMKAGLRI